MSKLYVNTIYPESGGDVVIEGDLSGSGNYINVGGIETAGGLNVSGSTVFGQKAADVHQFSGSVYVSGNLFAQELNTTIHNQTVVVSTLHKSGSSVFGNSNDDTHTFTGRIIAADPASFSDMVTVSGTLQASANALVSGTLRVGLEATPALAATHPLTVLGDISGSGKIFNLGGIETFGTLGVTGSATLKNNLDVYGNGVVTGTLRVGLESSPALAATHPLTVLGDISGSGKIFNLGGIETFGNIASSGSVTATQFTAGTSVITDDSIVMTPSTDDTVTIAAATHGALNITTVDDAAHGADMTLTIDGDTIIKAQGKAVARAVGTATASTTNIANAFSFIRPVIKVTADTQLYAGDSGALVMFNDAAATITLPDSGTAANLGVWFTFAVVNASAGTKKIIVTDTSNEVFAGLIKVIDTDSSSAITFKPAAGATNVSITFNGSTTGISGTAVTIVATATDEWTVIDSEVLVTGDPSSVSPFGTS